MNRLNRLESLWSLYRSTFGAWALEVGRFHQMHDTASKRRALKEAQNRATEAEVAHRDVRNRLAEEMAAGGIHRDSEPRS